MEKTYTQLLQEKWDAEDAIRDEKERKFDVPFYAILGIFTVLVFFWDLIVGIRNFVEGDGFIGFFFLALAGFMGWLAYYDYKKWKKAYDGRK